LRNGVQNSKNGFVVKKILISTSFRIYALILSLICRNINIHLSKFVYLSKLNDKQVQMSQRSRAKLRSAVCYLKLLKNSYHSVIISRPISVFEVKF